MTRTPKNSSQNLGAKLEALLFAYGEPMPLSKLATLAVENETAVKKALSALAKEYATRGFIILEKDGAYQLGTNPDYATLIETLVKSDMHEELSRASVETLSIIAYKGPLTRVAIEYIRGVQSSFTIRNLLLRGLVERTDNPKDLRSPLYRISFDCLKYLGIANIKELPEFGTLAKTPVPVYEEQSSSA